jgi:hypothetical protein
MILLAKFEDIDDKATWKTAVLYFSSNHFKFKEN